MEEKGRLKTSTTKITKMKWNRKVKQRLKNIIKWTGKEKIKRDQENVNEKEIWIKQ